MRRHREPARSCATCDAPGCNEKIRRGMLMCRRHWFALPGQLRDAINLTWARRRVDGLAVWSANCLEARRFIANNSPAAVAARITGDR